MLTRSDRRTSLVTVIHTLEHTNITKDWLQALIFNELRKDDVFRLEFLEEVIFIGTSGVDVILDTGAKDFLQDIGTRSFELYDATKTSSMMPTSGPYAFIKGRLSKVWRLYDDTSRCFMITLKPTKQG